ncbi:MAG: ABC transporter ATP-binding protein [Promethearchaeota archaeon]
MSLNGIKVKEEIIEENYASSEKTRYTKASGFKPVMILENLSKKYGKHLAVDNVNIEVYKGETIGLVGPNGAGKTTIIKMIAKLLRPTSGEIFIMNTHGELQPLRKKSNIALKFGFLIDVPHFYDMTANQLLRYYASSQNYPAEKTNDRIDELLQLFKLSDWKHKKVKTFSKGMTQKLGIIQALLIDPQIIILDEPQTGLDPKARIEIRRIIRELQKQGKTIFVASHMLHEISEVCDKIALINHGKIIGFDTIENLEKDLATKELNCQLLEPIPEEKIKEIIDNLLLKLEPYLDNNLDKDVNEIPIKYFADKAIFKIYYDGMKESRGNILDILVSQFKSDFTLISFTRPKTSKLEQIYIEMIIEDEPKLNIKKKG